MGGEGIQSHNDDGGKKQRVSRCCVNMYEEQTDRQAMLERTKEEEREWRPPASPSSRRSFRLRYPVIL